MNTAIYRRRGRPRIHLSNAARQQAYRKRKKAIRPPASSDPFAWNRFLAERGLSVDQGLFLKDAPAGRGKQHSGGNDISSLDRLVAKQHVDDPCGGGRRVRPKGQAPNDNEGNAAWGPDRSPDPGAVIQREMALTDVEEELRKLMLAPLRKSN